MSKLRIGKGKYRARNTFRNTDFSCHTNKEFDKEKFAPSSTHRGKVSKIMEFGVFVELLPSVEGLVHISELSWERVDSVSDVVRVGDWVDVVVLWVNIGLDKKV